MDITSTFSSGLLIILEIFMYSVATSYDSVIHYFATDSAEVISDYKGVPIYT
jgi:hypothetical protein